MKTQATIAALIAEDYFPKKESFYKILSTLVINNLFALIGDGNILQIKNEKPHILGLVENLAFLLSYELIESRHAKEILEKAWAKEWYEWDLCWFLSDSKILEEASKNELELMVKNIFEEEPKALAELKSGKKKVMGHVIGKIMKRTSGKANPAEITKAINKFATV